MNATVIAVSSKDTPGIPKLPRASVTLVANHGVDGDYHAGATVRHRSRAAKDPDRPNLRQVHLIHSELFDELAPLGIAVKPGQMGENITTRGLALLDLAPGARLHLGDTAVVEITGVRNPCNQLDAVDERLLAQVAIKCDDGSIIRKAGIMGIVLEGGTVRPGDPIRVELPAGARLGTSSLRRRAQLLALRPDLRIEDLRGNVPTRIARAEQGEYEAVVLARAGVVRLGLAAKITEVLEPGRLLPAVGQGAIAVEIREDDERMLALVAPLDHRPTRLAVGAERAFLGHLEGGCQVPIGALGAFQGARLVLQGLVAELDGSALLRGTESAEVASEGEARRLGGALAERLREAGAREILDRIVAAVRAAPAVEPAGGGEGD